MAGLLIGIDVGGTKIAAGIVSPNGKVLRRVEVSTLADKGKAAVLRQLRSTIDALARGKRIGAVGIGVPGLYRGTTVTLLPNIRCLDGTDLKKALRLPCLVALENDLRAVARAHAHIGEAKRSGVALTINVGTGLGLGILIGGTPYRGAYGNAGEAGHQWLDANGTEWEHVLSGPALLRRYRQLGAKSDRASDAWADRSKAGATLREEATEALALFTRNLCVTLDPDTVIYTGGAITKPYAKAVAKRLKSWKVAVRVVRSDLPDAGIIGAALWMVKPTQYLKRRS